MAAADDRPSALTLGALELLRQGRTVVEVSRATGLPPALVELIAGELRQGTTRPGGVSTLAGPGTTAAPGNTSASVGRRAFVTAAIAMLAVGSVLAALASTMLHNNVIGIVGGCCSVVSLLAVHMFTGRERG